ncbi:hypothetical protein BJ546DRAFT_954620 [Cryomyces antarcticus]
MPYPHLFTPCPHPCLTSSTSTVPYPHIFRSSFARSKASKSTPTSPSAQPPPDAPIRALILRSWDAHSASWGRSSDALADWLNARWRKSGYATRKVRCEESLGLPENGAAVQPWQGNEGRREEKRSGLRRYETRPDDREGTER